MEIAPVINFRRIQKAQLFCGDFFNGTGQTRSFCDVGSMSGLPKRDPSRRHGMLAHEQVDPQAKHIHHCRPFAYRAT